MKIIRRITLPLFFSCISTLALAQGAPASRPQFSVTVFENASLANLSVGSISAMGQIYGVGRLDGVDMVYATAGNQLTVAPKAGVSNMVFASNAAGDSLVRSAGSNGNALVHILSGGVATSLNIAGQTTWSGSMNAAGQVAFNAGFGSYATFDYTTKAYLYDPQFGIRALGTLGGKDSWVTGINDAGVVVGGSTMAPTPGGSQGFMYKDGVMTDVTGWGGYQSTISGINNAGQMVGNVTPDWNQDRTRGFLKTGERTEFLKSISEPVGVDGQGQVLSASGMFYSNGVFYRLESLVPGETGWSYVAAGGINEAGQISARRCKSFLCEIVRLDPLSPVPEPQTYAMLPGGMALLGFARLRRRPRHG
ncbi:PEP-CTERM sorting domain-containing protein [Janthinobacterium sp. FT14W]|uniref:PEP-CTERM sorting domain-containing protein n=1 Tax=Janthinobacterium sp. FT14W TaxID=2654253 RepID=UPI001264BBDB|nr:PEP-CTERM sorting domain-containing protein [Janthinobacterium sp. FT14W]KAB8058284.1 PEP-CTERM sorting domain-containing protein [Janthinobacterium sp. FT14W]